MKKCNKCGIEKPLTEYSKNSKSKDKYNYFCKTCTSSYNYNYHKTGRKRKDNVKFKYGLPLSELEKMYETQVNV